MRKQETSEKITIGKHDFWVIRDRNLPRNHVRLVSASYPVVRSCIVDYKNIKEIQEKNKPEINDVETLLDKILNNME